MFGTLSRGREVHSTIHAWMDRVVTIRSRIKQTRPGRRLQYLLQCDIDTVGGQQTRWLWFDEVLGVRGGEAAVRKFYRGQKGCPVDLVDSSAQTDEGDQGNESAVVVM